MGKPYGHLGNGYSVCMNCGKRKIGCHIICKDYIEETEKNKKISEERKKKENIEKALHHLDRPRSHRRSNNMPQISHMK